MTTTYDNLLAAIEGVRVFLEGSNAASLGDNLLDAFRAAISDEERGLWHEIVLTLIRGGTSPLVAPKEAAYVVAEWRRQFASGDGEAGEP